jgi:hypothetical protein
MVYGLWFMVYGYGLWFRVQGVSLHLAGVEGKGSIQVVNRFNKTDFWQA